MEKNQINTNIVVVCWNALDYTRQTIESLFKTVHHPYALTIVDNASSDGSLEYYKSIQLPKNCKEFQTILNKKNRGYGGAINQGYEISKRLKTKFTCVCNNDIFFEDNWLSRFERVIMMDKNIGIIGAMRPSVHIKHPYYASNAKQVVDTTPGDYTIDQELKHYLKNHTWENFLFDIKRVNDTNLLVLNCPPEVVVTYCALTRNTAINKLGYIADPQFKIYGSEDVDLSWSLQKLGYKCCVDNSIYIHHFRHKSINANSLDREKYLNQNNKLFFEKWSTVIYSLLEGYKNKELKAKFNEDKDDSFWLLRLLNKKIGFWNGEQIIYQSFDFNDKG